MSHHSFFDVLFDKGDHTCLAKDVKATAVSEISNRPGTFQFYSINALKEKRADANVTKHRTFLLEFDHGTTEQQLQGLKKLPIQPSAVVFSGGKSIHALFALETSVSSGKYKLFAAALIRLAKSVGLRPDESCKNPSRLSRFPNAKRVETGRLQALLQLNDRIPNSVFLEALKPFEVEKNLQKKYANLLCINKGQFKKKPVAQGLSPKTRFNLEHGIPRGQGVSHRITIGIAFDMAANGHSLSEIEEAILSALSKTAEKPITEEKIIDVKRAAEWALSRVA